MESSISRQISQHLTARMRKSAVQFQLLSRQTRTNRNLHPQRQPQSRHASNTARTTDKPIILEQPDKFRPPSHPQRLNARRTTGPPMGGYNQGATAAEREAQKTKRYPHMFPPEGTLMHRFLTNKAIHVWISLSVLTSLAIFTLTTSFLKTSPFAHLLPSFSTFPFHPITYIRETISVVRMHIDYNTEQTAQKRQAAILDAQKRRVYRRAHGMEDLNAKEDTGVDVRGIAPWDDGLTGPEREKGGRQVGMMTGQQIFEVGGKEAVMEATRRKEEVDRGQRKNVGTLEEIVLAANGGNIAMGEDGTVEERPKKKVKRWLGIWE